MPSRFSFAPVLLLGAVTTLGIAYVYTILTRPQVPDWKREEDREHSRCLHIANAKAHEYGFPKWYGGSASYSTYDPAQADEGRDEFFEILLFMGEEMLALHLTDFSDLTRALIAALWRV